MVYLFYFYGGSAAGGPQRRLPDWLDTLAIKAYIGTLSPRHFNKCICQNWQLYLSKYKIYLSTLAIGFVQITKCILQNWQLYLSKKLNVSVKIGNCNCPNNKRFPSWLNTLANKLGALKSCCEDIYFKTIYSYLIYFTTIFIFFQFGSQLHMLNKVRTIIYGLWS